MNNRQDYSEIGAVPISDYSEIGAIPVNQSVNQEPEKVSTFLGEMEKPENGKVPFINDSKMLNEMMRSFTPALPGYAFGKPILQHLEGVNKIAQKLPVIGNAINTLITQSPRFGKVINAMETPLKSVVSGAVMNPENPLLGGAIGGVLGTGIPAVGKAFNALRPSNLFRGTQTPEQLQNALNVTQGTETSLGNVLQSPFLKRQYENVLSKIPGSGINETMQNVATGIINKGQKIMKSLLGRHSDADVENKINDALIDIHKSHRQLKNSLYNNVDELAEKSGVKLNLPNFSNVAKDYIGAIEDTNILKTEPEARALLAKLTNYKNPVESVKSELVDIHGKSLISSQKYPTLKEANLLKGKFNDLAERYSNSPDPSDRNLSNVFRKLSSSLKSDIQTGIESSGNKALKKAYSLAEKNYAKNYSPFLDKDIYKYATGKADPDMIIQAFLKTGRATDRANLLDKLASKLPESKRKLLGYAYLKRAMNENGMIDPLKLRQLISKNKLGERQFEVLFPDKKLRMELRNYADLTGKNEEAFHLMNNPKTGQRLQDIIPHGAALAGYGMAGIPGALAGFFGAPLAARGINKLLTSPKVREKLVNKMIQGNK